ncbi:MAG: hypothetical protein N2512_06310, partial [Armatimonadetes bacterium]|nr:hypothetical protein [Armatimonadota bacterium]
TSFETSASSVRYVCSAGAPDGATDTVKLSVFRTRLGGRDFIGSAQGTVRVRAVQAQFALTPQAVTLKKDDRQAFAVRLASGTLPPGVRLECDWGCTSAYGTLFSDDESQTAPFTQPYGLAGVYQAGLHATGTDTITAKVMLLSGGDSRTPVGECSATVTVEAGEIIPASLIIWGPIYFVRSNESFYGAGVDLLFVFDNKCLFRKVIFHWPGNELDGTVGEIRTLLTRESTEAVYGGHNVYGLTSEQSAWRFFGTYPHFSVIATPPATEEWSAQEFERDVAPAWRAAQNDPEVALRESWTLELLWSW